MREPWLRRAKARGIATGERIAGSGAPPRGARRIARNFVRRARPEMLVRADFVPVSLH